MLFSHLLTWMRGFKQGLSPLPFPAKSPNYLDTQTKHSSLADGKCFKVEERILIIEIIIIQSAESDQKRRIILVGRNFGHLQNFGHFLPTFVLADLISTDQN